MASGSCRLDVAMCDGTARFISSNILLTTWQALSTSMGNEPNVSID
jgi:hypothetical protein